MLGGVSCITLLIGHCLLFAANATVAAPFFFKCADVLPSKDDGALPDFSVNSHGECGNQVADVEPLRYVEITAAATLISQQATDHCSRSAAFRPFPPAPSFHSSASFTSFARTCTSDSLPSSSGSALTLCQSVLNALPHLPLANHLIDWLDHLSSKPQSVPDRLETEGREWESP